MSNSLTLRAFDLALLANILAAQNRGSAIKALEHVFFIPLKDNVIISSSDLEIHLYWPVLGQLPGAASCNRAWLLSVIRKIREKGHLELRLDTASGRLAAYPSTAPSSRSPEASLPAFDSSGFNTAGFTAEGSGRLSAHTLRAAHRALPFVSDDETRYVIGGVSIEQDGAIAATNGRTLACQPTDGTRLPSDLILPPPAVKLLHGTLTKDTPDTSAIPVWVQGGKILASIPGTSAHIITSQIEGAFPNWRRVVPAAQTCTNVVTLNDDFAKTVRHHLSGNKGMHVLLDLRPERKVYAQCYGPGRDICEPFLAGHHLGTSEFVISGDAVFLLDGIAFGGPKLRLIDERSPIVSGDPGHPLTVVMPLRINSIK